MRCENAENVLAHNDVKLTIVGCLPPRSYKSDPVQLVSTGCSQPVSQLSAV